MRVNRAKGDAQHVLSVQKAVGTHTGKNSPFHRAGAPSTGLDNKVAQIITNNNILAYQDKKWLLRRYTRTWPPSN